MNTVHCLLGRVKHIISLPTVPWHSYQIFCPVALFYQSSLHFYQQYASGLLSEVTHHSPCAQEQPGQMSCIHHIHPGRLSNHQYTLLLSVQKRLTIRLTLKSSLDRWVVFNPRAIFLHLPTPCPPLEDIHQIRPERLDYPVLSPPLHDVSSWDDANHPFHNESPTLLCSWIAMLCLLLEVGENRWERLMVLDMMMAEAEAFRHW